MYIWYHKIWSNYKVICNLDYFPHQWNLMILFVFVRKNLIFDFVIMNFWMFVFLCFFKSLLVVLCYYYCYLLFVLLVYCSYCYLLLLFVHLCHYCCLLLCVVFVIVCFVTVCLFLFVCLGVAVVWSSPCPADLWPPEELRPLAEPHWGILWLLPGEEHAGRWSPLLVKHADICLNSINSQITSPAHYPTVVFSPHCFSQSGFTSQPRYGHVAELVLELIC